MSGKEIERQRSSSQEESMSDSWEGAVGRCAKCTEGSGKVKGERSSQFGDKRALAFFTKTASSGRSGTETRGQ